MCEKSKNELKNIYDTLISVCNAIVSVINVDITIVDRDLNRVAGTGKYVMKIGEQLNKDCLFAYALEKGEKFIIENPRFHDACSICQRKDNCKEWAQVCCPIEVDDKIIGIIGLIAFNKTQKDIILRNKDNLLDFLSNMADLIASKIKENRISEEISLMANELKTIVNSIDTGIISTDNKGNILRYNSVAKEIFNLDNLKYKNISKLITKITTDDIKKNVNNKEFTYILNNKKYRGFYSIKSIILNEKVTGFIFTFKKMKEIIKFVNDVASTNLVTTFDDIIGDSIEINNVKEYAKRISEGTSTVLIQGESGTGKELFARAIHYNSERAKYPFVAINCSAIPENLIESELFGYEEGAFTGAKKGGKLGKFELANKGTIFLDEIGDMPLNLQAKLLRVLQEGAIERVGGNNLIPVDVRIIAASNKLLEQKVYDKEFREDLFYRLNVIPIFLPPLRNRKEDIEVLANNFLTKYNYKLNRSIDRIETEVINIFMNYNWPGNVRELENVVEYAVNMCSDNKIKYIDLPRRFKETKVTKFKEVNNITKLKDLEKNEIIKAIRKFGNSKDGLKKAADELGISRATIYRKIKLYNIK